MYILIKFVYDFIFFFPFDSEAKGKKKPKQKKKGKHRIKRITTAHCVRGIEWMSSATLNLAAQLLQERQT